MIESSISTKDIKDKTHAIEIGTRGYFGKDNAIR